MPRNRSDWNTVIGKSINKLLRREPRPSLTESFEASAPVLQMSNLAESTQSTSNSLATSEAIQHARERLQQAIIQSVDDEDVHCAPDPVILDYIGKIERYSNHKLPESLTHYQLHYLDWQNVCLAAQAAKDIHKMTRTSGDALLVPGTFFGAMKPFAIFNRTLDGVQYLVVAIRATRTPWDWLVNFNAEPAKCTELGDKFKCHKGFLLVARNMKASVENSITEHISTLGRLTNIIFTGHSAGAAVAQLLFSLIDSDKALDLGPYVGQVDCITFGGPPVTFPPMPIPPSCRFLNIKNEGDPVTLAQPDYIESLLQAYVLDLSSANSVWKVPRPFYYSSGDQLILRDTAEEDSDAEDPAAFRVDHEGLNSVIFGNPLRHSMTLYLRRVEKIRERSSSGNSL